MRTIKIFVLLLYFPSYFLFAQKYNPQFDAEELKFYLGYLASEELQGRLPGTDGDKKAAEYIRSKFKEAGVSLLGDKGFQPFEITTGITAGKNNSFYIGDTLFSLGTDYTPLSFSGNGSLQAEVIFAGYGFSIHSDTLNWDDYAGMDVEEKWVMLFRADPDLDNPASPYSQYNTDRYKVMNAMDHGAAGVLFINPIDFDASDQLELIKPQRGIGATKIPVVQVKRHIAEKLIINGDPDLKSVEESYKTYPQCQSFRTKQVVNCTVDLVPTKVTTMNVIGMKKGKSDEIIVLGAHYDHLGKGGESSRAPGVNAVHYGADDNASGVGMLIEMAQRFSRETPERTVVYIAFGAEEMGLLGSSYFVDHSLIDLKKVKAMINLDMVGRLNSDRSLLISGTGTATQTDSLIRIGMDSTAFSISKSPGGTGPSDHSSFYSAGIPVLFFTTGIHDQYHTPEDMPELINYNGMVDLGNNIYELLGYYLNSDQVITFQETLEPQGDRMRRRMKVTLGIVPDFAENIQGMGVAGVRAGGPAYAGGILKGDIIKAIDGKEVTNIYDYMNRMGSYSTGQQITVEVLRGDQKIVLLIQL